MYLSDLLYENIILTIRRPAPKNEDEMMVAIFEYIDRLFNIVRPRRVLYMAIDGVVCIILHNHLHIFSIRPVWHYMHQQNYDSMFCFQYFYCITEKIKSFLGRCIECFL